MTQENYVTKNSYTREEADLLIAISEWVSAIGQLPESKALALDYLAAIQAKQVLQQPLPGQLSFPTYTQSMYLSELIYLVDVYLDLSKHLPPVHAINNDLNNVNNVKTKYVQVELANALKAKLDEDYQLADKA